MVSVAVDLVLECCGHVQSEVFDSVATPYLEAGVYRKNVTCQACGSLVIVDCRTTSGRIETQQEIVDIK